jgi:hypothetical protein
VEDNIIPIQDFKSLDNSFRKNNGEEEDKALSCPCGPKHWHVNPAVGALLIQAITNQHQIVL